MAKWGPRYGYLLPTPTLLLQDERRARWTHRFMQRLRGRRDRLARNKNVCPDAACAARALVPPPKAS
jgi:hypothetical protein